MSQASGSPWRVPAVWPFECLLRLLGEPQVRGSEVQVVAFLVTSDGNLHPRELVHVAELVRGYFHRHLHETTVVGSGDVSGELKAFAILVAKRKQLALGLYGAKTGTCIFKPLHDG